MLKIRIDQKGVGVTFLDDGTANIVVWAPEKKKVQLIITGSYQKYDLVYDEKGYWILNTHALIPGDSYRFIINGENYFPDPASLSQEEGVFGTSQAVHPEEFQWNDRNWENHPLSDYIIYELHTGSFTEEGNFQGIIDKLPYLVSLGVTAIEIMPVGQFSGTRNWGYDGVFPFAVQNSYGGYRSLQQLVDECHNNRIAVILDVVYNHIGPEGNCLAEYGPYFTDKYRTPWGPAINFDDAWCDGVRHYYLENALMWFRDFHIDALRLDAVHAIKDFSAKHILSELSEYTSRLVKLTGRRHYLIAESNLNDPKYIRNLGEHGYGMNAQWIDEFHHALRVTAGEKQVGYYSDFNGISQLAKSYRDAYVYDGIYSKYRKRSFGAKATGFRGDKFVVFSQNHDHVGNRMLGERTSHLVSFEMQKLLAGAVFISPYIPLLFMGEEWRTTSSFIYFVSHSDPSLIEAVRKGRKEEFREFHTDGEAPDPQGERAFHKSKLTWELLNVKSHMIMLDYYKALMSLRKKLKWIPNVDRSAIPVWYDEKDNTLILDFRKEHHRALSCMNFSTLPRKVALPEEDEKWKNIFCSADLKWKERGNIDVEIVPDIETILPPESITIFMTSDV
jgi:maltooligosyltrehalose trehalohydrolase